MSEENTHGSSSLKGRERIQEIVAATERLLLEADPDDLTLTEIAKEAGLKRTLVYYFFQSKSDIYDAMAATYFDELKHRCITFFNPAARIDHRAAWGGVARIYAEFFEANPVAAKLILGSAEASRNVHTVARPEMSFASLLSTLMTERTNLAYQDVDQTAFRDVFQVVIELMGTMFSFGMRKHGRITKKVLDEAGDFAATYVEGKISRP